MAFLFWLFRGALFFFGIAAAGGSFPKPLSAQEEHRCLESMQQGDEEARQKLIVHNLRLVSHVVRKYTVPGYTQEDLVSVGTLGLIKAINSYKTSSGTKLTTYAARCIENEVLMLLRASKKQKGEVSLFDSLGTDGEGNDISFADILGTPEGQVEDEVIRRVSMEKVRRAIGKLPRREKTVISMRYGLLDGRQYAQHQVAQVLGVSRSYVSRLESRAVRSIREELERT
ncbi:MAG: sigma-70 family RNA polymerase sigma factor [Clostridiales bacterium]|nr:sigma-70 family RNA polymerase sigma factor [Clostridiales bacterium]